MSKNRLPAFAPPSRSEGIRQNRLGDIRRLLRDRWRYVLPDDDAGRSDLEEMLYPISLGPEPEKRMRHAIELWASWMSHTEASDLIYRILDMPRQQRKPKARELGLRMRVTNEQRERLRLRTVRPFDMTDKQLAEQRKQNDRASATRRRRKRGVISRSAYLAKCKSKPKPWVAQGISRRTWFYRRKSGVALGPSGTPSGIALGPSATKKVISRRHT